MLGDTSYECSMDNYVTKPRILFYDKGYYIFMFHAIVDRDLVMKAGPYTYHNKPFILKNWKIYFYFEAECLMLFPCGQANISVRWLV